ncbi:MAG TPA: nitroreductase/quinone reductase family protein [Candidatus Binataceae bacterium]|nr:nitroreductase/quinone reductase family protein [Candidatus Binataceae bacterium]
MHLSGEYEASRNDRDRKQVELYEASNGIEGGTLNGKPVIILTFKGAKSGKIRKTAPDEDRAQWHLRSSRLQRWRSYASFWYRNIVANPMVELQDGAVKQEMRVREVFGEEKNEWWKRADAAWRISPPIEPGPAAKFRYSSSKLSSRVLIIG